MKSSCVIAFAAGLVFGAPALADSEWASAQVGNWSLASNWNPMNVPDLATELATLAVGPGSYTVTLDGGMPAVTTIRGLVLSNPEVTLNIIGGRTLSIAGGTFQNDGSVRINSNGSASDAVLDFSSTTSIVGSGTIRMLGAGDDSRLMTSNGAIVTNESTILGRGEIHAALVNAANGLIAADVVGGNLLVMRTNDKVNAGTMRAQGGAVLTFFGIGVDNNGGLIEADAATVQFTGTGSVTGGSIASSNGGTTVFPSGASTSLSDLSTSGTLNLQGGAEVQVLGSGISNSGTITVNSNGSASDAVIRAMNTAEVSGAGSIVLQGFSADSRIETEPDAVLTIGSNQTVVGRGQINAALINNGLLHANVLNNSMEFRAQGKTNNGTMRATNGGILNLQNVSLDNTLGSIELDGGTMQFPGGTTSIAGGTITTTNGGSVLFISGATSSWIEVEVSGTVNMNGGGVLNLDGAGLINNAEIVVNNNGSASDAVIRAINSTTITGTGAIRLQGNADDSRIETEPGSVLTLGSGQVVSGRGQVNGAVINDGLFSANVSGGIMQLLGLDKTNHAIMQATNNGILDLQGFTLTQSAGGVLLADGGTLRFPAGTASVTGGTIATANAGVMNLIGGATTSLSNLTLSGAVNLNGGSDLRATGSGFSNDGLITVNNNGSPSDAHVTIEDGAALGGSGTVRLQGLNADAQLRSAGTGTIGPDQTVIGQGQFSTGTINFEGTIAPGFGAVGTLNHAATLNLTPSSVFDLEIASTASHDRLNGTGTVQAGGTLRVSFVSGYVPVKNHAFTFINVGAVSGDFDAIDAPPLTSGLVYRISSTATTRRLHITCGPDLNLDGVLDFFDVQFFLAAYSAQEKLGDYNEDGMWDFFDVQAFLNAFSQGCP